MESHGDEESLAELGVVVRRVLAARTRDSHLVEDLVQETLVRVAATEKHTAPASRQAYAITTARNLLVSHARGESVHGRHAHRLVDYVGLDGPEQLTLQQEETDALAIALDRLDEADRDLLLRHEDEGIDLATLAAELDTTQGAVAMRLARSRAALRLEFVLAFRHVDLPLGACRPVLLALSAGDRRRQHRLHAQRHLATCTTCAALAHPITERDRRTAGWIPLPLAGVAGRLWQKIRDHPAAAAGGLVAVVVAVVAVALAGNDEPSQSDVVPSVPAAAAAAAAASPTATAAAAAPLPATTAVTASTTPGGAVCPPPAPLDRVDPAALPAGCSFAPTTITVTEVPEDEAFIATTAAGRRIWVFLVGTGESPVDIQPGRALTVVGHTAVPPPGADASSAVEVAYHEMQPAG